MRRIRVLVVLSTLLGLVLAVGGCGNGGNTPPQGPGGPAEGTGLVRLAAARTGLYGLRVPITNPLTLNRAPSLGSQYVQDDTPVALQQYLAHVWMRLDDAQLTTGDRLEVFNGYSMDGNAWFKVEVERGAAESRLVVSARENGGGTVATMFAAGTTLPPGYNQLMAFYDSVSGTLETQVNGAAGPELTGLNNGNGQVDYVRLGIVEGNHDPASSGFIDFDDFGQGAEGTLPTFATGFGLPPLTTFACAPQEPIWTCLYAGCGEPGGTLGGETFQLGGFMEFSVTGTGGLSGFVRTLSLLFTATVDVGPSMTVGPVETWPTELIAMNFGSLFGDPDFDTLEIEAGQSTGLPPTTGTTQLTDNGDGTFQLDSFFDVTYRINYIGAPGSILEGFSSSGAPGTSISNMFQADPLIFEDGFESGDTAVWSVTNP